jgi:hypothetical protein
MDDLEQAKEALSNGKPIDGTDRVKILNLLDFYYECVDEIAAKLKVPPENLVDEVDRMQKSLRERQATMSKLAELVNM